MLIVMAGVPATGKSTIARALAASIDLVVFSVDPIEAAMLRAGVSPREPTGLAAYVVAEQLAREHLLAGRDALIDAVNDAAEAREQWRSLASALGTPLVYIEVFCSDADTHRRRLHARRHQPAEIPEPAWSSLRARRAALDAWDEPRLRLDSMNPLDENLASALAHIQKGALG